MSDNTYWNDDRAAIIKECYELAARFESSEPVRNRINERKEKIPTPSDYISMQSAHSSAVESEMSILSPIIGSFSLDKIGSGAAFAEPPNAYKLSGMNDSAEAHYLQALLAICRNPGDAGRNAARNQIIAALRLSGNDPRYQTFAEIMQEADR